MAAADFPHRGSFRPSNAVAPMKASLAACVCLLSVAHAKPPPTTKGIVAYSPGALGADYARAAFYVSLDAHPFNYLATDAEGRTHHILRKEMVEVLELSAFSPDLSTEAQRLALEADLVRLRERADALPVLRPFLPVVEEETTARLARYAGGERLVAGVWRPDGAIPDPSADDFLPASTNGDGLLAVERLETLDGKVYGRARIVRVELDNAVVFHSRGVAVVPAAKFDETIREAIPFDYTGAEAVAAARRVVEDESALDLVSSVCDILVLRVLQGGVIGNVMVWHSCPGGMMAPDCEYVEIDAQALGLVDGQYLSGVRLQRFREPYVDYGPHGHRMTVPLWRHLPGSGFVSRPIP